MSSASRRGFTALEMLVVIGIFTLVTGVVMASLPQFREKTLLDLTAQQMATIIRQAQVYGLGTRSVGTSGYPSHGAFFCLPGGACPSGVGNKNLVLFADIDPPGLPPSNNRYNIPPDCGVGGTECVEKYTMQGAVQIAVNGVSTCDSGGCTSRNPLNILFNRPNPEANFFNGSGGSISASYAKICIQSTRDPSSYREIRVSNTGQIYARLNNHSCS